MAAEAAALKKLRAAAAAAALMSEAGEEDVGFKEEEEEEEDGDRRGLQEEMLPGAAGREEYIGGHFKRIASRQSREAEISSILPRDSSRGMPTGSGAVHGMASSRSVKGSRRRGPGERRLMRSKMKAANEMQQNGDTEEDGGDGGGFGSTDYVTIDLSREAVFPPSSSARSAQNLALGSRHWAADADLDDDDIQAALASAARDSKHSELRAKFQQYRRANMSEKSSREMAGRSQAGTAFPRSATDGSAGRRKLRSGGIVLSRASIQTRGLSFRALPHLRDVAPSDVHEDGELVKAKSFSGRNGDEDSELGNSITTAENPSIWRRPSPETHRRRDFATERNSREESRIETVEVLALNPIHEGNASSKAGNVAAGYGSGEGRTRPLIFAARKQLESTTAFGPATAAVLSAGVEMNEGEGGVSGRIRTASLPREVSAAGVASLARQTQGSAVSGSESFAAFQYDSRQTVDPQLVWRDEGLRAGSIFSPKGHVEFDNTRSSVNGTLGSMVAPLDVERSDAVASPQQASGTEENKAQAEHIRRISPQRNSVRGSQASLRPSSVRKRRGQFREDSASQRQRELHERYESYNKASSSGRQGTPEGNQGETTGKSRSEGHSTSRSRMERQAAQDNENEQQILAAGENCRQSERSLSSFHSESTSDRSSFNEVWNKRDSSKRDTNVHTPLVPLVAVAAASTATVAAAAAAASVAADPSSTAAVSVTEREDSENEAQPFCVRLCTGGEEKVEQLSQQATDGVGYGSTAAGRGEVKLQRLLSDDDEGDGDDGGGKKKTFGEGMSQGGDSMEGGGLTKEELAELDHEVIQEIYDRVEKAEKQVSNYLYLLFFLLFVGLYLTVLFLQVQSTRGYQITLAHQSLLPPGMDQTSSFQFANPDEFWTWLNQTVIQTLWKVPVCGDGICQRPLEFRAFDNSNGCALDCGYFPNVTQVQVFISTEFDSEEARQLSSWNLCLLEPISACWYKSPQPFPSLVSDEERSMSLPDGDWVLILTAPMGGVRGSVEKSYGNVKSSLETDLRAKLLSFGSCKPASESSMLQMCRATCAMFAECLHKFCHKSSINSSLDMAFISGAFADCLDECQLRPDEFSSYYNQSCSPEVSRIFSGVECGLKNSSSLQESGASSRRLLSFSPSTSLRMLLPASSATRRKRGSSLPNVTIPLDSVFSPVVSGATLWSYLGPDNDKRIARLQVAVNRLIFTMVKHECLAAVAQSVTNKMRQHLTSVLCTLMGGPASLQQCQVRDPRSKQQITAPSDLFRYAYHGHRGRSLAISAEHMEHFKDLALMAVESVTVLDSAAVAALYRILSAFSDAIIDPNVAGCPRGLVLPIHGGAQYNSTVQVGGQITWTWNDDKPHSIQVSSGDLDAPSFQGFGGGRLLVSKDDICTPRNIGPGDPTDDPAPCVLRRQGQPSTPFSYTRVFRTPGTVFYSAQQFGASLNGRVNVVPAKDENAANSSSLSFECQPGCQLALISNGRCDAACNTADCAFDGGDCSCSWSTGKGTCSCSVGQILGDDGACCATDAVGSNLQFPFSLRTYGANASESMLEFVEENRFAFNRYVAGKNRLILGMILRQTRWSDTSCPPSRYLSLSGSCSGPNKIDPFGRNPYFLPGSPLYNPLLASRQYSAALNINYTLINLTSTAPDGTPYGFYPVEYISDYYPLVFGINLARDVALRRLQYLRSGFYFDNHTNEVDVSFVTYNADERFFVLTEVECQVESSGSINVQSAIHPISLELYHPTTANAFRITLEVLYIVGLFCNLLGEIKEILDDRKQYGAYSIYFTSMWNWVDISSLAIQFVCVGLWIQSAVVYASDFSTKPRYDIYLSTRETPFPWALIRPSAGLQKVLQNYDDLSYLIELQSVYFCLQGINIFLYVMRILKLLDFQPHMGIFTRTLNAAANGLFHFFLLWVIVFVGFSTFGCIVFGRLMEPFSTLSSSMLTCFLIVLGDTTAATYFEQLDGWEYAAAMIFWVSFVTIIVFILLNFLIAIIVDAFMDVKDIANDHDSLVSDIASILRKLMMRLATPYRRHTVMLRDLQTLGGAHKLTEEELRLLQMYRTLRRSTIGRRSHVSRSSEKVFRINDMAIDYGSLNIILERSQKREEPMRPEVSSFNPEDLGKAVMRQFGDKAKPSDFEESATLLPNKRPKKEIHALTASFEAFKEEMRNSLREIQESIIYDDFISEENASLMKMHVDG